MDTRMAFVGYNMVPDGLSSNCIQHLRDNKLIDATGRFRVDPKDERVSKIMKKYNTTLFVLQ